MGACLGALAAVALLVTTAWAAPAQQAYVKASNAGASDSFGYSVAVSGDTMVVRALGEASNATEVNGDQTDNDLSFLSRHGALECTESVHRKPLGRSW